MFSRSVAAPVFLVCGMISFAADPQPGSITTRNIPILRYTVFDSAGGVYSTVGVTPSANLVTAGAAQTAPGGGDCTNASPGGVSHFTCDDALIVKWDSSGNKIFATFLGGPTADDSTAIAADPTGNVYVIGTTHGSFPTTANAAIPGSTTSMTFAAKLSADGSKFLYSTYLPDSITAVSSLAVDSQGNAYIAGNSSNQRIVVLKLSSDGSLILYNKAFGGSKIDAISRVAADSAGNAYVTGSTTSPDFPVTSGAFQTHLAGAENAYVTKIDTGGNFVYSTFLGGSGTEFAAALQVDSTGDAYIAGGATSTDFPTTPTALESQPLVPMWSQSPGGFLAKLAPDGASLLYSSYLWFSGRGVLLSLNNAGDLYVAGESGNGLPLTASAPMPCSGSGALLHFDPSGALRDATFTNNSTLATVLASGADGSVFVGGQGVSQIRFGDPGWVTPACIANLVFNSATLARTSPTPGEFVSLTGFGIGPDQGVGASIGNKGAPLTLGGVQVLFDGVPAPVTYAQSTTVNTQIPFELAGRSKTSLTLVYNGTTFGPIDVTLGFAGPALFRLQPGVTAQAFAVNQDGTLNTSANPAPAGSIIALWGTGMGAAVPGCATNQLNPDAAVSLPPGYTIPINNAGYVQYNGSAPTLACGIVQINVQILPGTKPGPLLVAPFFMLTNPDGTDRFTFPEGGSFIYVN